MSFFFPGNLVLLKRLVVDYITQNIFPMLSEIQFEDLRIQLDLPRY
jgi:hypothetical protein